jgi:general secretion pathway protein F
VAVYAYKGLDARGKTVTGAKDAESPKALRALLKKDGIIVTECAEARAGKTMAASAASAKGGSALKKDIDVAGLFQRIKPVEVAAFTRQLATLMKAGIPLAEGLGVLVDQIANEKLKSTVSDVKQRVNEGSALADALSKHPKVFEEVFVSMVRAGETAGNLDEVLMRLAEFMESSERLKSKIGGAMIYPIVMFIVSAAILSVLMISVVPQITQLFDDAEQALPWNTELLIFVSRAIGRYWWLMFALVILGVWGLRAWIKSENGRPTWDRFKLVMPLFGPLIRQIAVARFARTLGTMLASGVPLLKSLDIAKDILGNVALRKVIEGAREQIQQGESIAGTLKKSGEFPAMMVHMVAVGERAGQLEQMLANVATTYELDVENKLGKLASLLEPLIIVGLGGAVGFVVFSILMPIMKMNQFAQ